VNLAHPLGTLRFNFPSLSNTQAEVALVKVGALVPLEGTRVFKSGIYKLESATPGKEPGTPSTLVPEFTTEVTSADPMYIFCT
jgi:hypothetical protein